MKTYMDIQQAISFAILRRFRELGIDIAHLIRMLHLAPNGGQDRFLQEVPPDPRAAKANVK